MAEDDPRLPVTVVTGALGAGKTTLVNHLLTQTRDRRIAVVVNEFGDAGIDGALIDSGAEELVELSSGCVCCVVRGDLIRTLRSLARREPRPDAVVIETTGLANPAPVIQTFMADQILSGLCRLDGIVTLVDALHVAGQLAAGKDAADQIAMADLLILNKTATVPDLAGTEATLRRLNPFAPILRTERARVGAAAVLDRRAFVPERVASKIAALAVDEHDHDHVAAQGIASVSVLADAPLDAQALERWLSELLARQGADILRVKGIVDTGSPRRQVIQAVHMLAEGAEADDWPPGPRQSRVVFIGRGLDAASLRTGLAACALH